MRWRGPLDGQMRRKTRFLLFPKTIRNQTRWLERATWIEKYDNSDLLDPWNPIDWIDEGGAEG